LKPVPTKPLPFLHFEGTTLYYSTPVNTSLYIKCIKDGNQIERSTQIYGIGQATYSPACTINLPDGTYYKTPSDKVLQKLDDWPIFNVDDSRPHNVHTSIKIPLPNVTENLDLTYTLGADIAEVTNSIEAKDVAWMSLQIVAPVILTLGIVICVYPLVKRKLRREQIHKDRKRQEERTNRSITELDERDPYRHWHKVTLDQEDEIAPRIGPISSSTTNPIIRNSEIAATIL